MPACPATIRAAAAALLLVCAPSQARGQAAPRTDPLEVHEASLEELANALAAGRASSVDLVDSYLERIAAYDRGGPALNAIVRLNPAARSDAEALDRERRERGPRGPLHGIPVLLKDNYEVAGLVSSNGSLAFAGWVRDRDAVVVTRLREAGAVILGLTNMHEMASGITTIASVGGQTRNPYDPSRNPGGSSGGTGAAIAASFAALGWGSDTCGSIRIPASHQSLFGLRPTQGLFDTDGIFPLSHTQDVPGPLARTVTDLAIGLDATLPEASALPGGTFRSALDSTVLRDLRIGLVTTYFGSVPEEVEVTRVLRMAVDSMTARGVEVVDLTIPGLDSLLARSGVIPYELKWDLMDFLAARPGAPVHTLSEIVEGGLHHLALENNLRARDTVSSRGTEQYRAALATRDELRGAVLRALGDQGLDALVYPTIRRKPAAIGEAQNGTTCQLSAHTGLPAITMPAGFTADGLPVGLEVLGPPLSDQRLVGIAYAFEQATSYRRPPYSTPPLVDGRAPPPMTLRAEARGPTGVRAIGQFTLDITRSALEYTVRVEGAGPEVIHAVTLDLVDQDRKGPVVHQLLASGSVGGSGAIILSQAARQALQQGRLAVVLYTRDFPAGTIRQTLRLP